MTVEVTFRWGHLDRMPKCPHGRVPGFCACWDQPPQPQPVVHPLDLGSVVIGMVEQPDGSIRIVP